ncbi:MAG: outer membrane beta-barrel protein [Rikenellaceae bacterium]|jgi:hypothetical protein|nr:outer membrane beta-barrel protein [Rikenellaceae bacterium]
MKKSQFIPLVSLLLPFAGRGEENPPALPADTGSRVVVEQQDRAFSISKGTDNNISIYVGGFELELIRRNRAEKPETARKRANASRYRGSQGYVEFGFNVLTAPDYSAYPDDEKGFLDLHNGKSTYVGIFPLKLAGRFTRDDSFCFCAALGLTWHDYVFDNNLTLVKRDGMVHPEATGANIKKSKLGVFSLTVPLMLESNLGSSVFIAAGPYGQLILDSHTKYKHPKQKAYGNYGLDVFQWGVTARMGVKNIYLFGNCALSKLFRRDNGPKTNSLTFGVGIRL